MARCDAALITVSRGQIKQALGDWYEDAASQGLAEPLSEAAINEAADYLMFRMREHGARS